MFNEYFITSILELSKPLELLLTPSAAIVWATAAGPTGGPQPTLVEVLDFECVNEGKVNKVITSLSNLRAKDLWGLDSLLLKNIKRTLQNQLRT